MQTTCYKWRKRGGGFFLFGTNQPFLPPHTHVITHTHALKHKQSSGRMWTVWDLKPHRKEGGISGWTRETGRTPCQEFSCWVGGDVWRMKAEDRPACPHLFELQKQAGLKIVLTTIHCEHESGIPNRDPEKHQLSTSQETNRLNWRAWQHHSCDN